MGDATLHLGQTKAGLFDAVTMSIFRIFAVHLTHLLKWFMFLQLGQRNNTVASPSLEQFMSDSGQVLQGVDGAYCDEITTALIQY